MSRDLEEEITDLEDYTNELHERYTEKKAELAKVKQQLAIAVETLFHYSSDNKDNLSNEDKETADQALQQIKELDK